MEADILIEDIILMKQVLQTGAKNAIFDINAFQKIGELYNKLDNIEKKFIIQEEANRSAEKVEKLNQGV